MCDVLTLEADSWSLAEHEHRIYVDESLLVYAVVDDIDYWHFVRWCWKAKISRGKKQKHYLHRNVWAPEISGQRGGGYSMYLHIEIMKRTGIVPSSLFHNIVDHIDGNSLNCRRDNLRWETPSGNRLNVRS